MNNNEFSFALGAYLDEIGFSQERKNKIFSCMNDDINNVRDLIKSIKNHYSDHEKNLKYLNIPEIINKILPEFEDMQNKGMVIKSKIEVLKDENQILKQEIEKLKEQNALLLELKGIFMEERKPCHVCHQDIGFNKIIYADDKIWCKSCFKASRL